ncbi:helix-turn-helix transcriptional regulator [Streptomyces hokutonensis]|uniref:helix-turn-helix transcriptional regulator n=1 Tax=Streptomyces hokutonensis TaxID=1306990 RepID=UPI00368B3EB2
MDQRSHIREFLSSRRARITPQQAGLSVPLRGRRVPGLRREEVATLAGLSVEYYTRLERGKLAVASDSVLNAIAGALQLDDVEREHLFDLARADQPAARPRTRRAGASSVDSGVQAVLDALVGVPAMVRSPLLDVVATNHLGRALYAPVLDDPRRPANFARFTFLDPRARDFWVDWPKVAGDMVGHLQAAAGRDPHDRALTQLVGELSTCSEEFRVFWARRDVRVHARGVKVFKHPVVGHLELAFEVMHLPAEQGLLLVAYTAAAGTSSHDNLSLLNAWAATSEQERDEHPQPPTSARPPGAEDSKGG